MSDSGKAVFLSYASQDAEAAKRICEALRAAGVEVWFDQSELVGGDAWDQKIRKQIKECALFVPLVSANTQSRLEGYFRLEWKLAAQRTHTMADAKPFLLPVVIDGTRDADAHVPEEFRAVQWTRLGAGEPTAAFGSRVKELLAGPARREAVGVPPVSASRGLGRIVLAAAWAVVLLGVGWWLWRVPPAVEKPATSRNVAAPANEKTIAVLPFDNLSEDKENAFFADGVHEDLLTNLASLRDLRVISRTSVMQYRGATKNLRQIARDLDVAYVLEGSVRRAGMTIRVTGQLIKAATDEHLWAKSYDRELKDIFAVQTELAREIADSLHAVLSPTEVTGLEAHPTKSIEAYDCYQKARVLGRANPNERDVRGKIIPLLERAVALDPEYAAAWALLSSQHLALFRAGDRTETRRDQVWQAIKRAEQLAPDDYAVLAAGYSVGGGMGDRERATARSRRIIELFSNRPEARRMEAQIAVGANRVNDALTAYRAALRLDPRNPEALNDCFLLCDSLRRWDEAALVAATLEEVQPDNLFVRVQSASMEFRHTGSTAQLTRLLAELPKDQQSQDIAIQVRARIAQLTGDWAGLVALWRETGARFRSGSFRNRTETMLVGTAFLKLGEPASARPLLEEHRERLTKDLQADPADIGAWTQLGVTLGMLGQAGEARKALDQAGQLMAARSPASPVSFTLRWDYAVARSWVDEKSTVIRELERLLREPTPHLPPAGNVRVLRIAGAAIPLHGDPEFEAMLNDPKNNAPLF